MGLILGFVELLGGFLLITKGVGGDKVTWKSILQGKALKEIQAGETTSTAAATAGTTSPGPATDVTAGALSVAPATGTETGFARAFLNTIGAPLNATNIKALEDWWAAEEGFNVLVPGHGGLNNPFEVTTSGAANVPTLGSVNSAGVKSYATTQQGVDAAVGYFLEYGPGVIEAFQKGESISDIEAAVRALGPNAFGSDTADPWAS